MGTNALRVFEPDLESLRRGSVILPYQSTGDTREDTERRFKALRGFCDAHGVELEEDEVSFLAYKVEGPINGYNTQKNGGK